MLESPVTLPRFRSNAFSINQLLDISDPMVGSPHVGSSSFMVVVPPEIVSSDRKCRQVLSPDQFK